MGEAGRDRPYSSWRSTCERELSTESGRRPFRLPIPNLRRDRLPALVALTAPAEDLLMMLWEVACVLLLADVALLCQPEDEFVALLLVVKVLPSALFPSSYADFLCRARRCR